MTPDFLELTKIEERLLASKLDAVRAIITHAGEKGRSLEGEIISFLKTFLPNEYGLSSGFVVFQDASGVRLSTQLDIIIYDSLRGGPIARFGTCDVFPLEAVYGYIEVKASLRSCSKKGENKDWPSDSIEKCIDNNQVLRRMVDRRYMAIAGKTSAAQLTVNDPIPIRGYVVAFSSHGSVAQDPKQFAQQMADYLAQVGNAHLHGVLIAGSALYMTVPVKTSLPVPEAHNVKYVIDHPLAEFKWTLLHDLGRYPRIPPQTVPAIDRYRPKALYAICSPKAPPGI
nr:DUF6602 domain-containing protein [Nitrosomonas nitrosa]